MRYKCCRPSDLTLVPYLVFFLEEVGLYNCQQ